jgi:acyl-coenzyme A thioesterase PaaI-like protein
MRHGPIEAHENSRMTYPDHRHKTIGDWAPVMLGDPFADLAGPIHRLSMDSAEEPVRFGMLVEDRHCNRLGFCHGGLLATFLDIALGVGAIEAGGQDWGGPTIHLGIDYLQGAPKGDWIESRFILEHGTRSLLFVTGSVIGSAGKIATCSALFKQPRPRPVG